MKVGHMYVNSLGAPRRNEYQRHRSDLRFLSLLAAALMGLTAATAHGEVVDDVIDALKIRDHLRASEEQCRNAALGQAQRQVAESVNARLAGRVLSDHERSRIEELSRTYAREACRLGIDEGLIQRYRAAYRAALSDSELNAALAFLSSPEGRSFSEAGLAANHEVLPLIGRRQESQASRAATFLQTRLTSLLSDLSKEKSGAAPSAQ